MNGNKNGTIVGEGCTIKSFFSGKIRYYIFECCWVKLKRKKIDSEERRKISETVSLDKKAIFNRRVAFTLERCLNSPCVAKRGRAESINGVRCAGKNLGKIFTVSFP